MKFRQKYQFIHFLLALGLITSTSSVHGGGEGSGGALIKARFEAMSPEEAFDSNTFRKRVWNIHMPGTSTWFKPSTSLCIDWETETVQTVHPVLDCEKWAVELKRPEAGERYKLFNGLSRANDFIDSSNNDKGRPQCVDGRTRIVTTPVTSRNQTFTVEYYRKVHSSDRYDDDYFLGEHEYEVFDCRHFNREPEEEIEMASGEGSGGALRVRTRTL